MIGIDWGTTSFRAFRLDAGGAIADRVASAGGILAVAPGGFEAALRAAIGPWLAAGEDRVLLAGMVGSRQGWVEAPYLPCPAGPEELAAALLPVPFDGAALRLVPGLSARDAAGVPEVMRGEETQLAGVLQAVAHTGPASRVCLPGSHSKWARIANGRIAGFATHLTGEAFAALRDHTILGRMMIGEEEEEDGDGFARGVARSAEPGGLLHHLFGVRALGLTGELSAAAAADYLSGLLIGHEIRQELGDRPERAPVHLVGAAPLCARYARAIATIGGLPVRHDADAAARGLALIGAAASWN